ncbi:MAG TPA: hypothetical protein VFC31_00745 [Candidatus Limnocylindria bacterium]|nr:hypothetical protein [Candidatus Limnocylindria bacterium]
MGLATRAVVSLLNACVLAVLSLNLGGATIGDGAMLGVICWLGFMAIVQVVMGAVVTAWR